MLRNNGDARRCSYFELGLPVVSYVNPYNLASSRLLWDFLAPCELSGDRSTHEYPPQRAKTGILFIQWKVHANEKQIFEEDRSRIMNYKTKYDCNCDRKLYTLM